MSTQDLYKNKFDPSKYDPIVSRKVNSAKANRIEYCIVLNGHQPPPKIGHDHRMVIVVNDQGGFVKTYYG